MATRKRGKRKPTAKELEVINERRRALFSKPQPPPVFTTAHAEELVAIAELELDGHGQLPGPEDRSIKSLRDLEWRLNSEADLLEWTKYLDETTTSFTEVGKKLDKLIAAGETFARPLEKIDNTTLGLIATSYETRQRRDEDFEAVKRLVENLKQVRAHVPKEERRGPKGRPRLHVAARAFAEVFKDLTGERFTFERHIADDGSSAFLTSGGRFVATALRRIWPEITDPQLTTAMRNVPRRTRNLQ